MAGSLDIHKCLVLRTMCEFSFHSKNVFERSGYAEFLNGGREGGKSWSASWATYDAITRQVHTPRRAE